MEFFGREEYLDKLDALWRKRASSLVVVSGRRRIGKSTLVEEFARRSGCTFIEIAGLPPEKKMTNARQLENFCERLAHATGLPEPKADCWAKAFDALASFLSPALDLLGVDARLVPLLLVRPFSGSGAIAALSDVFAAYGPDSDVGLTASVLLGSSETIFYTLALYFGSVGVKKTRFTVPVALAAMLTSVVTGLLFSSLFFGH